MLQTAPQHSWSSRAALLGRGNIALAVNHSATRYTVATRSWLTKVPRGREGCAILRHNLHAVAQPPCIACGVAREAYIPHPVRAHSRSLGPVRREAFTWLV